MNLYKLELRGVCTFNTSIMNAICIILLLTVAEMCHSFPATFTEDIIYDNCNTSSIGIVSGVSLNNCNEKNCILKKGKLASFEVVFTPKTTIKRAALVVNGGFNNGISFPFIKDPDVCGDSIECPLRANRENSFKMEFLIKSYWPSMNLNVEIHLKNGNLRNEVFCVSVGVRII